MANRSDSNGEWFGIIVFVFILLVPIMLSSFKDDSYKMGELSCQHSSYAIKQQLVKISLDDIRWLETQLTQLKVEEYRAGYVSALKSAKTTYNERAFTYNRLMERDNFPFTVADPSCPAPWILPRQYELMTVE